MEDFIDADGLLIKVPLINGVPSGLGKSYFKYDGYTDVVSFEVPYVNGLKNGKQINYSLFGGVKSTIEFVDGLKNGEYIVYDKDNIIMIFNYKDDVIQGNVKIFYDVQPQQLKETYDCIDGKIEGVKYTYYSSGKLASLNKFKNNLLNGVSYSYREDGMIKESVTYKDGEIIIKNGYDLNGVLSNHYIYYSVLPDVIIAHDYITNNFLYKGMYFKENEFYSFINGDESVMSDPKIKTKDYFKKIMEFLELINKIDKYLMA